MSDQVILACHLLCREGKRQGNGERKTFWNGDDDDGDGCDQDLEKGLTLLFTCVGAVAKANEEHDEQDEEEETTSQGTEFGDVAYGC